jgi:hypothetical protein
MAQVHFEGRTARNAAQVELAQQGNLVLKPKDWGAKQHGYCEASETETFG